MPVQHPVAEQWQWHQHYNETFSVCPALEPLNAWTLDRKAPEHSRPMKQDANKIALGAGSGLKAQPSQAA